MITAEEVQIGNRFFWKPAISDTIMLIQVEIAAVLHDNVGYVRNHIEHRVEPFEDDILATHLSYATYNELQEIPLTGEILEKINLEVKYPGWIKHLHELQNWFYWTNEKKELKIND